MTAEDDYKYTVNWSEDDQEWVGRCNAFPLLSWLATERAEALAGTRALVADGVDILEKLERAVPEPTIKSYVYSMGDSPIVASQPDSGL